MKKYLVALATLATSSALALPMHVSPNAVRGCHDTSYVYRTSMSGQVADEAAKLAKYGFCKVASYYAA